MSRPGEILEIYQGDGLSLPWVLEQEIPGQPLPNLVQSRDGEAASP